MPSLQDSKKDSNFEKKQTKKTLNLKGNLLVTKEHKCKLSQSVIGNGPLDTSLCFFIHIAWSEIISKSSYFSEYLSENIFVRISLFTKKSIFIYLS